MINPCMLIPKDEVTQFKLWDSLPSYQTPIQYCSCEPPETCEGYSNCVACNKPLNPIKRKIK